MPNRCPKCPELLVPGQRIFQLARGIYYSPHITPTYHDLRFAVLGEWHEDCFRSDPTMEIGQAFYRRPHQISLMPHEQPYTCGICTGEIERDDRVFYLVLGTKPDEIYIRPEARGYGMQFIAHEDCWLHPEAASRWHEHSNRRSRVYWTRRSQGGTHGS